MFKSGAGSMIGRGLGFALPSDASLKGKPIKKSRPPVGSWMRATVPQGGKTYRNLFRVDAVEKGSVHLSGMWQMGADLQWQSRNPCAPWTLGTSGPWNSSECPQPGYFAPCRAFFRGARRAPVFVVFAPRAVIFFRPARFFRPFGEAATRFGLPDTTTFGRPLLGARAP